MKYKAVIFDLFGTLVDNFSFREQRRVLAQMASILSVPKNAFKDMWVNDTYLARSTGELPSTKVNILHICAALGVEPERVQVEAAAFLQPES